MTPSSNERWGPPPPHATPPRRRRSPLRWLERLLLVAGIALLGYYGYVSAEAALYQAWENRELDMLLSRAPDPEPAVVPTGGDPAAASRRVVETGSVIGRLEIPRLGVSTVVRAGIDTRTLRLAIGHVPGTALPGDGGNIGLAAHRDTFFRRLGEIRSGDHVRLVTPEGTFTYAVEGTKIVEPTDVWVLDPTEQPALTLITCYPFSYFGAAPQRFIVRATRSS